MTTESYDQRQFRLRRESAYQRYVDTYGEPPLMTGSVLAHLDTCERIGCGCDRYAPWLCGGAMKERDGRCPCECHA